MGYYIETGQPRYKADSILADVPNSKEVALNEAREAMNDANLGVVCVVENGFFDAAGFCFDLNEFDVFADPKDDRPKRWITMPRSKAETLSNFR